MDGFAFVENNGTFIGGVFWTKALYSFVYGINVSPEMTSDKSPGY